MEFKAFSKKPYPVILSNVLIESDWNLKSIAVHLPFSVSAVLIESDWNLKPSPHVPLLLLPVSINRIRLEFKAECDHVVVFQNFVLIESDWNLKHAYTYQHTCSLAVLIESDWNLKPVDLIRSTSC